MNQKPNPNQNKATLSLSPLPVAPPPTPGAHADILERFPLPWCVGPYGDIWVAADVETFDPDKEAAIEKIPGPGGTWWRATCAKPRMVMENPSEKGIAALIVDGVNRLAP